MDIGYSIAKEGKIYVGNYTCRPFRVKLCHIETQEGSQTALVK